MLNAMNFSWAGTQRMRPVLAACAALVLLQACSTKPQRTGPPPPDMTAKAPAQNAPADNSTPKAGGRYYDNDGPPLELPADLATRPDAVPRIEILSAAANRPYSVFGQPYVPLTAVVPFKQRGIASWYGRMFHGRKTSNGEVYDMLGMTAAHPTLPLPSYARVRNVQNGRQVVVRVNDRGPFLHGRIMDLSYAAAYRLGYSDKGSAELEVELLQPEEIARWSTAVPQPQPQPVLAVKDEAPKLTMTPVATPAPEPAPPPAPAAPAVVPAPRTPPPLAVASASGRYFLQIGAFSTKENADAAQRRLANLIGAVIEPMQVVSQDNLFKLQAGPYANRRDADSAVQQVKQRIGANPFVLQR